MLSHSHHKECLGDPVFFFNRVGERDFLTSTMQEKRLPTCISPKS